MEACVGAPGRRPGPGDGPASDHPVAGYATAPAKAPNLVRRADEPANRCVLDHIDDMPGQDPVAPRTEDVSDAVAFATMRKIPFNFYVSRTDI